MPASDKVKPALKTFLPSAKLWLCRTMLLCALAVLPCGCVYISPHTLAGACSNDMGSPIRNFCVVTPGVLWRAEAPTRSDAQWLLAHGIATVVSLELNVQPSFETAHPAPGTVHSVVYYRIADFSAIQVLTHRHLDEHVAKVLAIIQKAPKPVLVSCRAGVDRTGIIAAAYRVLIQGMSQKAAIAELVGFHSPWNPLNAEYIRSLKGARKAKIRRDIRQAAAPAPNGTFECRQGACRFVAH